MSKTRERKSGFSPKRTINSWNLSFDKASVEDIDGISTNQTTKDKMGALELFRLQLVIAVVA